MPIGYRILPKDKKGYEIFDEKGVISNWKRNGKKLINTIEIVVSGRNIATPNKAGRSFTNVVFKVIDWTWSPAERKMGPLIITVECDKDTANPTEVVVEKREIMHISRTVKELADAVLVVDKNYGPNGGVSYQKKMSSDPALVKQLYEQLEIIL